MTCEQAVKRARELVEKCGIAPDGTVCPDAEVVAQAITTALLEAHNPPKDHVLDSSGVVRRDDRELWKREAEAWRAWWPHHAKSDTSDRRTAVEANAADFLASEAWERVEAARRHNEQQTSVELGSKGGRSGVVSSDCGVRPESDVRATKLIPCSVCGKGTFAMPTDIAVTCNQCVAEAD